MIFAAAGSAGGGGGMMIILMIGLIALMYFMMIRPQRKEQKRMREMLGALEVGDAIVTTSGFYGIVIDISETDVIVEFGNNRNCRIPMKKDAIAQVEKPEQAAAQAAPAKKEEQSSKKKKDDAPFEVKK